MARKGVDLLAPIMRELGEGFELHYTGGPDAKKDKPAMPINRIKGATDMVRQIGEAIYMLDLTIDQWNEQLKRAQPHRNGRVALIFTPVSRTMLAG